MPDIYSTSYDGYITIEDRGWADVREATSGDSYVGNSISHPTAIEAVNDGGTRTHRITRSFLSFNVSAIYDVPSAVTLRIRGRTNDGADFYCVRGTQPFISVSASNFDSIYGWVNDADNSSNVRKYSSEITTWYAGIPGVNTITLNDNAKADIAGHEYLQICMIEADYDLTNTAPSDTTAVSGMFYTETLGTNFDPMLSYTAGVDISPALMQINF